MRATAEERQWQHALTVRSRPAIIDPDLVDVAMFNGLGAEPAFTDLASTARLGERHDRGYGRRADDARRVRSIVEETLSIPAADLLALDESREKGEEDPVTFGSAAADQRGVRVPAQVRELVAAGQPVTPSEWQSVYSILVQVTKRRRSAKWREEERLAGVTLSPDFFVPPDALPAQATPTTIRWRASQEDRFDWLDTLQSRVDQERSLLASFLDVVSGVEEVALPALRDALVPPRASERCPGQGRLGDGPSGHRCQG